MKKYRRKRITNVYKVCLKVLKINRKNAQFEIETNLSLNKLYRNKCTGTIKYKKMHKSLRLEIRVLAH